MRIITYYLTKRKIDVMIWFMWKIYSMHDLKVIQAVTSPSYMSRMKSGASIATVWHAKYFSDTSEGKL